MNYLIFIFCCGIVSFLYFKFLFSLMKIWIILFCFVMIGLIIMPLSFQTGLMITSISIALMIFMFFLGLISGIVSAFVFTPFLILWAFIKKSFKK